MDTGNLGKNTRGIIWECWGGPGVPWRCCPAGDELSQRSGKGAPIQKYQRSRGRWR